jgi:thioredoxin reductase (NADPH)
MRRLFQASIHDEDHPERPLIGSGNLLAADVCGLLVRNGHPYSYIDLERDADVQNLLDGFRIAASEIPVVICRGQLVLRNPTNQQLADCLGYNENVDQTQMRDVVIIGAGPSGLAAAVYG